MWRAAPLVVAALLAAALAACARETASGSQKAEAGAEPEWFVDRAQASGVDFVHFNGMSGSFYQPEIMGPGVGLFDYDNDGDLDLYVAQGQMLGSGKTL